MPDVDELKLEQDGTLSFDPTKAKARELGGEEWVVQMRGVPAKVEYTVIVRAVDEEEARDLAVNGGPDDPRILEEFDQPPVEIEDVSRGYVSSVEKRKNK